MCSLKPFLQIYMQNIQWTPLTNCNELQLKNCNVRMPLLKKSKQGRSVRLSQPLWTRLWGVPGGNTLTPREEERGRGVDDVAVTWQEFFRHRVLVSGSFSHVFCLLCGRTGPAIPPRRGVGVVFVCCDGHGRVGRGTGGWQRA